MNIIDIEKNEDRELIIKTSSLDKKIEYAKEGFFLDILYQDTNPEVRIEVAKKSAYLEELKDDPDYLVKLEVLKKKGLEFMQFKDLNKEHLSIIEEAVKQGYPTQRFDYNNNMQIKLLILKEKGLSYCNNNNVIESYSTQPYEIKKEMILQGHKLTKTQIQGELGSLYISMLHQAEKVDIIADVKEESLLKGAILSGYKVQNFSRGRWHCLFKDKEFRFACIKKGFYLKHILQTYGNDIFTVIEFIKYGYTKYYFQESKNLYSVLNCIKELDNIEIYKALKIYHPIQYNELKIDKKILEDIEEKEKIKNFKNNVISL